MERVVLRIYHMAELGKSLLLEPLGGQCVFILCSREFLGGITGAFKSGKNVKHTAEFDVK